MSPQITHHLAPCLLLPCPSCCPACPCYGCSTFCPVQACCYCYLAPAAALPAPVTAAQPSAPLRPAVTAALPQLLPASAALPQLLPASAALPQLLPASAALPQLLPASAALPQLLPCLCCPAPATALPAPGRAPPSTVPSASCGPAAAYHLPPAHLRVASVADDQRPRHKLLGRYEPKVQLARDLRSCGGTVRMCKPLLSDIKVLNALYLPGQSAIRRETQQPAISACSCWRGPAKCQGKAAFATSQLDSRSAAQLRRVISHPTP